MVSWSNVPTGFAAGEEDMSVTLDLAVNFCGLPGGN